MVKGQLISKGLFGVFNFLPKKKNENKSLKRKLSTALIIDRQLSRQKIGQKFSVIMCFFFLFSRQNVN